MGLMNLLYVTPRQLLKVMINLHGGWGGRGRGGLEVGPASMGPRDGGRLCGQKWSVQECARWEPSGTTRKHHPRGREADSREPSSGLRICIRKSENTDSQVKVCRESGAQAMSLGVRASLRVLSEINEVKHWLKQRGQI